MKKIVLIILLLSFKTYSQDLIGSWKVISYEDEIVYYNKSTDSVAYKDPSRKSDVETFKRVTEEIIFTITYDFKNNGEFTSYYPVMGNVSGRFEVDKLNNKIILINTAEERDELLFSYQKEILYLEMKMEDGFMKLGLKKV